MVIEACKDGLSAACFKADPAFARRAFSFRLLHAFIPPKLSSKLFTFLGLIRFMPGDPPPEWINLPPWWLILPGAVWPPDWVFGDPLPPGVWIPPDFYLGLDWSWPAGPDYLNPSGSGPTRYPYSAMSPPVIFWLYDGFSSIDLTLWEKSVYGAATIDILTNAARFISESPDYCVLKTASDLTIPDKWVFAFRVNIFSYSGVNPNFFISIYTGSHHVKLRLNPPTTVWHATGAGADEITEPYYVNQWEIYKLYYDDGYTDLYSGSRLISSNQHHQHSLAFPGRIKFDNNNTITSLIDYVSLIET